MKTWKKISTIIAVSTILSAGVAYANNDFVAIGPKIGTQGIGLNARVPLNESFFGRIGVNYFEYKRNFNDGQIDVKGKLTLLSAPIMLDWHPIEGSAFRLSAGVAYNGNKLKATGTPDKPITIKGTVFAPNDIGTVTSKLTLGNAVAGIVSLGYDNSFINNGPLSFNFEAGVMYAGNPKLTTKFTGLANNDSARKALIEEDLKRGVNKFKKYLRFYPVLSIGARYTF